MIDTIKLAVYREFNDSIFQALLFNSNQKQHGFIINNSTGLVETSDIFRFRTIHYDKHDLVIINGKVNVPTYNYDIHYRIFDDRFEIEFSLPKFIYGTNVLELRNHYFKHKNNPYELLVISIKKFFEYFFFGHKIDYGGIKLLRFDFCYNQVFNSYDESIKALKYIKLKHSKKKDVKNYEYGYVELSKTSYLKIYHKGEEFKKHDKLKIKNYPDQFEKMADKILRYEKKFSAKNYSYWYNINYKHQSQHLLIKEYYKAKKNGNVTKQMRKDFESLIFFTLGKPKINNCIKLDEFIFNHLYTLFRQQIKQKFSIMNTSVDRLKHEVINENDIENKTMKVRILALIKTFGSLQSAREAGALSKATFYRYRDFMNKRIYLKLILKVIYTNVGIQQIILMK